MLEDLIQFYERNIYHPNLRYNFGVMALRMDPNTHRVLIFCKNRNLASTYADYLSRDFRFGGIR